MVLEAKTILHILVGIDDKILKFLLQRHVSGEDETVAFIDLKHNNLKLPEKKGILKKHDYGMVMGDGCKDNWGDGAQTDDLVTQSENLVPLMKGVSMADVERTLTSLNGYHEDVIKALRNAATHRGSSNTPSGSCSALSEEVLRRSLQECTGYPDYKRSSSQEKMCDSQVSEEKSSNLSVKLRENSISIFS